MIKIHKICKYACKQEKKNIKNNSIDPEWIF